MEAQEGSAGSWGRIALVLAFFTAMAAFFTTIFWFLDMDVTKGVMLCVILGLFSYVASRVEQRKRNEAERMARHLSKPRFDCGRITELTAQELVALAEATQCEIYRRAEEATEQAGQLADAISCLTATADAHLEVRHIGQR